MTPIYSQAELEEWRLELVRHYESLDFPRAADPQVKSSMNALLTEMRRLEQPSYVDVENWQLRATGIVFGTDPAVSKILEDTIKVDCDIRPSNAYSRCKSAFSLLAMSSALHKYWVSLSSNVSSSLSRNLSKRLSDILRTSADVLAEISAEFAQQSQ